MRRLGLRTAVPKTALSVFDVDEMIPRINRRLNVDLVTSEHTNPAGWPRGTEPLCPFVTLSKRGIEPLRLYNTVYLRARRTSVSGVNPNGRQKMPAFFEGMGISFDTAVLRSVGYYKTVLYPRKGSSDSSHIPQPAIAGLGFAPNGVNAFSSPQNFDSPFGLPQDDTLTLETLWLFVTLSEAGVE